MAARILVVEDEPGIRKLIGMVLQRAEFEPILTADARQAWSALAEKIPDLVMIDWMLPGTSGVEMARRLRKARATHDIPIIMVTARGEEDHRVTGLDAGADDYIVKPFTNRELVARVRALLRRSAAFGKSSLICHGTMKLDLDARQLSIAGAEVPIGPTEFRLFHFLMTHPRRVYTRQQLLDHVWGSLADIEERTVDVHVRRLRRCLEPHGCDTCIDTVRGVGYRFAAERAGTEAV